MKKINFMVIALFLSSTIVWAEDEGKSEFTVGADFVSSFVWRGMHLSGTSIQPAMNFTIGNFTVGSWGSVDLIGWYKEVDLMASYSFGNFTAGLTNYWAGEDYFDYSESTVHQLEANLSFTFDPFPLTLGWNTIIAGTDHFLDLDDNFKKKRAFSTYIEAAYAFSVKEVNLQVAMGISPWKSSAMYTDGYMYATDKFAVVNMALTASKNIKISDTYSMGVFGQLSFNPAKNDAFFVFGINF